MTLNLIHLSVQMPGLFRWARDRFWASGALDEGRALHHLLSECYGKGALQPFRLMVGQGARRAGLYAYSVQSAEALRDMARTIAPPEACDVISPEELRAKPLPAFQAGQRLGFDVTLLPTRRLRQPLEGIKARSEVDAWLVAKLRHGAEDREQVYLDWLDERMDGAGLDRAACHLARLQPRKLDRNGAVAGTQVTVHGTAVIEDPDAFTARLARGIGRHSAYGFGMVLLRAPGKAVPGC